MFIALLLLSGFAGPAAGRPRAPVSATFHVRITLSGEVLVDRDMIWTPPNNGEAYARHWSVVVPHPCRPGGSGGISTMRGISVRLRMPVDFARVRPAHVFMLEAIVTLPMAARGRDGTCAANPAANEFTLSQVVVLGPGESLRIDAAENVIAEVTRR
jgi:hypothetical protein